MTNEEFLKNVENILEKKNMTLYSLQKKIDKKVICESTFYGMFNKRSAARIEYINEIGRVLGMSVAELVDQEHSKEYLSPIQIEILEEFKELDIDSIKRILPIIKGVIIAEKSKLL